MSGVLYCLPNSLGGPMAPWIYPALQEVVEQLDGLIAESFSSGRRFLQQFQGLKRPPMQMPIAECADLHDRAHCDWLLEPVRSGQTWGLLADVGVPCVADPGFQLVGRAQDLGIALRALPGPSAPLLALLLSGLPCQQYVFHGYLPKQGKERDLWLRGQGVAGGTHVCIEAPHRNQALLDSLCAQLPPGSRVVVASDLLGQHEEVLRLKLPHLETLPEEWASRPAVFVWHVDSMHGSEPRMLPRSQRSRYGH